MKNWWDKDIHLLHLKLNHAYVSYRESSWQPTEREVYKEARKQFRTRKRHNQKMKRDKTYRFIESLFKSNKESFWCKIARLERNNNTININVEKIKTEYERIFTESNRTVEQEEEDKKITENFLKQNASTTFNNITSPMLIGQMINSLSTGKAIGLRGISHEMMKFNNSKLLHSTIANLFDLMINHQVVPQVFNVSVIKPIIKDIKKPNDDINNIRPIAISDAISNLYERVILHHINRNHTDVDRQFGFKPNSSCLHAGFVLKCAINCARARGQRLYACALDASKAFDKVSYLSISQ